MDIEELDIEELDSASSLVADNAPAIIYGLVSHWPALNKWKGESGLEHLQHLAGNSEVEMMVSRNEDATFNNHFAGDSMSLRLMTATLGSFLDGSLAREFEEARLSIEESEGYTLQRLSLYLAQCAIKGPGTGPNSVLLDGPLNALFSDIDIPELLESSPLWQISFWANMEPSRSSLHYDPHSNILCVVTGRKEVRLLPHAAREKLRGVPSLCSESANHSQTDLWDVKNDVDFKALGGVEFSIGPGDALFIPEGWWHQVNSEEGTLAVNFWWDPPLPCCVGSIDDDKYIFGKIAQSIGEKHRDEVIIETIASARPERFEASAEGIAAGACGPLPDQEGHYFQNSDGVKYISRQLQNTKEAGILHVLVSQLVHNVDLGTELTCASSLAAALNLGYEPFARILLTLLEMHPDAVARLLTEGDALCWELLTTGFVATCVKANVGKNLPSIFYDQIYESVPEGRSHITHIMLKRKEEYMRMMMEEAVAKELQLGKYAKEVTQMLNRRLF